MTDPGVFAQFFAWIESRSRARRPRIIDPVFGEMDFEHNAWSTSATSQKFEVIVYAPESGPSEAQREYFKRISPNLEALEKQAKKYLATREDGGPEICSRISLGAIWIQADNGIAVDELLLDLCNKVSHYYVLFRNGQIVWHRLY